MKGQLYISWNTIDPHRCYYLFFFAFYKGMRHTNRGRPVLSSQLSALPDTSDSLFRTQGHQETLHTRLTCVCQDRSASK